jgi:hypothetical protein
MLGQLGDEHEPQPFAAGVVPQSFFLFKMSHAASMASRRTLSCRCVAPSACLKCGYHEPAGVHAVDPVTLYNSLAAQPFQPVRIYLKDGRTYDIRFRQLAIVGATWLDIGLPVPGEPQPIYDAVGTIPLEQIDRVARMPATETTIAR